MHPFNRFTRRRSAAVVAAVALVAPFGPLLATSSGATGPDVALMHSAVKNAIAKKHVTITARSTYQGIKTIFVTRSNPTSGIQSVTYVVSGAQYHATLIFIHGLGYLKGDAVALSQYLGISQAQGQQYADQWIEIDQQSPNYAFITGGVTISSALSEVPLSGSISTTAPSVVAGVRVTTLKGIAGANSYLPHIRETLSISTSSPSLPVKESASGQGITQVLTFSGWGHTTPVTAPVATLQLVTGTTTTTTTTTTMPVTTTTGPTTTTTAAPVG